MRKKVLCTILAVTVIASMTASFAMAEESSHVSNENIVISDEWQGETLTMILSQGWADERLDEINDWFAEDYGVTVDVQYVDADNYTSVLQAKLTEGECADIFWIQSDPFTIADYYTYCEDLSGSWWQDIMPAARQESCIYDGSLYGLQLWHNSPEWLIIYNKTLLSEVGYDSFPTTYDELNDLCAALVDYGVDAPWFMAGSDGWYHQCAFFQIGPVFEEADPGLYDSLNDNTGTFAGNEKMTEVLDEFKELADNGYFGDGWISDTYTNYEMALLDRTSAFTMQNPGVIDVLAEDGSEDDFDIALIPLGDNTWYPTNSQGPTMFIYNGSDHVGLAEAYFSYICDTACLQSMLDNWTDYTNLDVTDENVVQGWSDKELAFLDSIDDDKMTVPVIQVGTKYTNSAWNDFGDDMIAMCQGSMTAEEVLENMDGYRADLADIAGDPDWE